MVISIADGCTVICVSGCTDLEIVTENVSVCSGTESSLMVTSTQNKPVEEEEEEKTTPHEMASKSEPSAQNTHTQVSVNMRN